MKELPNRIQEASDYIRKKINKTPRIGLILGSGLGVLGDEIDNPVVINYDEIPYFPKSTVEGHAGRLLIGELEGNIVIAMQGRFHYYEGYKMEEVTFPVRVMKNLGVEALFVTNAAGGVNLNYGPGDLMLITDHINFGFDNPLIGSNYNTLGPRFPDTSTVYDKGLQEVVKKVAEREGIALKEGVYMMFTGPTYETPAEVRMARFLGADAVGMSTVPEVIVAAHGQLKVVGISCITNMAAGILEQPLNHQEVIDTANQVKERFITFVRKSLQHMGREEK
ncbi:purine-nucleoside phosphorylase [Clostridiaceae bacterium 35-E11]